MKLLTWLPVAAALVLLTAASCESAEQETPAAVETADPCLGATAEQTLVVQLLVESNRDSIKPGDPIAMTLSIKNCSAQPVQRVYRDGQSYDFAANSAATGEEVWRWSDNKAFTQAIVEKTFAPRETVVYMEVWDQKSNDGQQVPPGRYEVLAGDVGCEEAGERCGLSAAALFEIEED